MIQPIGDKEGIKSITEPIARKASYDVKSDKDEY
jgi:hypothetical protein